MRSPAFLFSTLSSRALFFETYDSRFGLIGPEAIMV
jgi:hypothetical protein